MAQRRLSGISKHISISRSIHTTSSRRMTLAKPADSLKEAKVLSRGENKEPKWVQLEGMHARQPAERRCFGKLRRLCLVCHLRSHQVADAGRQGEGLVRDPPICTAHSRVHSRAAWSDYHPSAALLNRESASRKTRGKSGVDAVSVLALISHPKSESRFVETVSERRCYAYVQNHSSRTSIYCSSPAVQVRRNR